MAAWKRETGKTGGGIPRVIRSRRRQKDLWLDTMVLPGAVWLLLIRYLPMFGIVIAFKNYRAFKPNTFWNNIYRSEWVGLKKVFGLNAR